MQGTWGKSKVHTGKIRREAAVIMSKSKLSIQTTLKDCRNRTVVLLDNGGMALIRVHSSARHNIKIGLAHGKKLSQRVGKEFVETIQSSRIRASEGRRQLLAGLQHVWKGTVERSSRTQLDRESFGEAVDVARNFVTSSSKKVAKISMDTIHHVTTNTRKVFKSIREKNDMENNDDSSFTIETQASESVDSVSVLEEEAGIETEQESGNDSPVEEDASVVVEPEVMNEMRSEGNDVSEMQTNENAYLKLDNGDSPVVVEEEKDDDDDDDELVQEIQVVPKEEEAIINDDIPKDDSSNQKATTN
jgi:hypothetical protein